MIFLPFRHYRSFLPYICILGLMTGSALAQQSIDLSELLHQRWKASYAKISRKIQYWEERKKQQAWWSVSIQKPHG